MVYIEMKYCYKCYQVGDMEIVVNCDVNFEIEKGELVIILGVFGVGKLMVFNFFGGMDINDEGEIWIDGVNIVDYSFYQRINYCCNDVGFVFQFYNLVFNLIVKENVELVLEIVIDVLNFEQVLIDVGLVYCFNNFLVQFFGGE